MGKTGATRKCAPLGRGTVPRRVLRNIHSSGADKKSLSAYDKMKRAAELQRKKRSPHHHPKRHSARIASARISKILRPKKSGRIRMENLLFDLEDSGDGQSKRCFAVYHKRFIRLAVRRKMGRDQLHLVKQYLNYLQSNGGVDWMHEAYIEQCRELKCVPCEKYRGGLNETHPGQHENEQGPETCKWRLKFGVQGTTEIKNEKKQSKKERQWRNVYNTRFERMLQCLKYPNDTNFVQSLYEDLCARNGVVPFDTFDAKKKDFGDEEDQEPVRDAKLARFEAWGQ